MPARSSWVTAVRNPAPCGISTSAGRALMSSGDATYQAAYPPAPSTTSSTSAKKVFKWCAVKLHFTMQRARLSRYGLLSVTGADARAFLHSQLTNDVEHLAPDRWALAGWCSAKGRLLASFLVIPAPHGFFLQLARDLAEPVAKRLAMFVLRAKVKISDESNAWAQHGVWDAEIPGPDVAWNGNIATVR